MEFAIVSVLLFTLLFGIIQYGYTFFQQQAASSTVREAARLAAVGITDCAAFVGSVKTRAEANGLPTGGGWAVVSDYQDVDGDGRIERITDTVTVTLTWTPVRFGFPFVPFPGGDLIATAQASVEDLGAVTGSCP